MSDIANFDRPYANIINKLTGGSISEKSVLLTGRHLGSVRSAKDNWVGCICLGLRKESRTIKGIYRIQNFNFFHSRLKNWICMFKGVATKYLIKYLCWLEFFGTVAKDKTQESAGKALLLRECEVKAF